MFGGTCIHIENLVPGGGGQHLVPARSMQRLRPRMGGGCGRSACGQGWPLNHCVACCSTQPHIGRRISQLCACGSASMPPVPRRKKGEGSRRHRSWGRRLALSSLPIPCLQRPTSFHSGVLTPMRRRRNAGREGDGRGSSRGRWRELVGPMEGA
jgi:hypothetical protein